jgi:hypothetical protein
VPSPAPCPVNVREVAEAYLMRSLPEEEVEAFEVHYFVCAACVTVLQHTAEYVEAMRTASRTLRSDAQHCKAAHGSS